MKFDTNSQEVFYHSLKADLGRIVCGGRFIIVGCLASRLSSRFFWRVGEGGGL